MKRWETIGLPIITITITATFLGVAGFLWAIGSAQKDDLPEGFEQIIPRGRIAAINNPQFVPADDADIDDDTWVLGVEFEDQARAFSLNLLNAHEVVNDTIGDTEYAAVW